MSHSDLLITISTAW